jgi:hypothetical protein
MPWMLPLSAEGMQELADKQIFIKILKVNSYGSIYRPNPAFRLQFCPSGLGIL